MILGSCVRSFTLAQKCRLRILNFGQSSLSERTTNEIRPNFQLNFQVFCIVIFDMPVLGKTKK